MTIQQTQIKLGDFEERAYKCGDCFRLITCNSTFSEVVRHCPRKSWDANPDDDPTNCDIFFPRKLTKIKCASIVCLELTIKDDKPFCKKGFTPESCPDLKPRLIDGVEEFLTSFIQFIVGGKYAAHS